MAKGFKLYDLDDKGWGSSYTGYNYFQPVKHTSVVQKTFTGNKFNIDLVEGQAIDANERKSLGVNADNLKVTAGTTVHGEITFEQAGYHNTLGAYEITKDGTIKSVTLVVPNTDNVGASFDIETSSKAKSIGFFILPDGYAHYQGYQGIDLNNGKLEFITNYNKSGEHLTKVTDSGKDVSLVFTDNSGKETVLDGQAWHTNERGGSNSLNSDGMVHAASGIDGNDSKTLTIAFEDLPKANSDQDYNDVVFNVNMKNVVEWCDPVTTCINNFVNNIVNVNNNVNVNVNNNVNNNAADMSHIDTNIAKAMAAVSTVFNVSVDDHVAITNQHA